VLLLLGQYSAAWKVTVGLASHWPCAILSVGVFITHTVDCAKTANIPSNILHRPVASTFWLSHAKRRSEIPTGPPTTSNADAKRTLSKFGYNWKNQA